MRNVSAELGLRCKKKKIEKFVLSKKSPRKNLSGSQQVIQQLGNALVKKSALTHN